MHVVIYLKAQQLKDSTVQFEGPILGPVSELLEESEAEAKRIVSSMPKFAIIPKIYKLEGIDKIEDEVQKVLIQAERHFAILKNNMIESKEIMDKPIHRSKKKKRK